MVLDPSRVGFAPLAGGYLPSGAGAGARSQTVNGASAVADGSGGWTVTLDNPQADSDMVLSAFPAPGSNLAGGICFGVSSGGTGIFSIIASRQSSGAQVDVPLYFIAWRRPKIS